MINTNQHTPYTAAQVVQGYHLNYFESSLEIR